MTEPSSSDFFESRNSDAGPPRDVKARLIDALMDLVAERGWEDVTMSDVARRADATLGEFRDAFPSKGAVLGALSRRIDRIVLDGSSDELVGEPAKDRLFDVLMRRLDALRPYKAGIGEVLKWAPKDPLFAAALNQMTLNSMRFMLEAARINADGAAGAIKLQGLALAWARILGVWTTDDAPDLSRTMAAVDRELDRGATLVSRVEDMDRLAAPFRSLAWAVLEGRGASGLFRRRSRREPDDGEADSASVA